MIKRRNESWTEHRLRNDFGMNQNDRDALFKDQNHKCAICGVGAPRCKQSASCLWANLHLLILKFPDIAAASSSPTNGE